MGSDEGRGRKELAVVNNNFYIALAHEQPVELNEEANKTPRFYDVSRSFVTIPVPTGSVRENHRLRLWGIDAYWSFHPHGG